MDARQLESLAAAPPCSLDNVLRCATLVDEVQQQVTTAVKHSSLAAPTALCKVPCESDPPAEQPARGGVPHPEPGRVHPAQHKIPRVHCSMSAPSSTSGARTEFAEFLAVDSRAVRDEDDVEDGGEGAEGLVPVALQLALKVARSLAQIARVGARLARRGHAERREDLRRGEVPGGRGRRRHAPV